MTAATTTRRKAKAKTTATAHPLAALIPDAWYGEDYIPRQIHGVLDIDVLRMAQRTRDNVLLEGPTGPGKTSLVLAYAAIEQIPVVTIQCNGGADVGALFGEWQPTADGGWHFFEGPVVVAAKHGGILYLDEVNMMPGKITAVLHGALDKRRTIIVRGGTATNVQEATIKLHPDCQVIASYNPGYNDTKELNEAFKNRFAHKMVFDYERSIEEQFVGLPILLDIADKLRSGYRNGELRTPTPPNLLLEFEAVSELGLDYAIWNFVNAYHEDERGAVREIIDLHRGILEAQVDEYWSTDDEA